MVDIDIQKRKQRKALAARDHLLRNYELANLRNTFWIGEVAITIWARRGFIEIRGFHIEPALRGKGLAAKAMREFLACLDKRKVPCRLIVTPYNCRLSVKKIRDWYAQFGFQVVPGWINVMRRQPN